MLYYLHTLTDWFSPLRLFQYITFRAICAAATAFILSLLLAPLLIARLRRMKYLQIQRKDEAPALHALHGKKKDTPTMGGLLIVGSVTIATLLWAVPGNPLVILTVATLLAMCAIGFRDDYAKISHARSKGLSASRKLVWQMAWGAVVAVVLLTLPETREYARRLMVPFVKFPVITDMGWLGTSIFVIVIIAGASNAVNLTDGLDGLAIGCTSAVSLTYLAMAYVAGHAVFADYLQVPFIAGSGELAVFCGALLGASLGFLWYNSHPAHVFMGDTGSLAIGGAIAMVAIAINQELALIIVGGVFVIEALSVIIQVVSFKWRGKRVFKMAPLHHHFELKQWSETQVTIRFWIMAIICALMGMATLKIR